MLNLIVPVWYKDREVKVYVPQPLQEEVMRISKLLSYIYKAISQDKEAQEAIIIDWQRIKDEAIAGIEENLKNALNTNLTNFFIRCIDGLSIIDNDILIGYDNKAIKEYLNDEDFLNRLKGTILFTLALSRYLIGESAKNIQKSFFTSFTILELMKHYKKQSEEFTQEVKTAETQKQKKIKSIMK